MATEEEKGGQEFAKPDQAIVDSAGNEFSLQGIDIPDRPKDLLADLEDAQKGAQTDKYGGERVWICDSGPSRCYCVCFDPHHQAGSYKSHPYLLSALEDGSAVIKTTNDGGERPPSPQELFNQAKDMGGVPNVDSTWQKWHGTGGK